MNLSKDTRVQVKYDLDLESEGKSYKFDKPYGLVVKEDLWGVVVKLDLFEKELYFEPCDLQVIS
jgi:hypothetical protein